MTEQHPPRLARWLLDQFGVSRVNESIAGDLFEEYQRGRSRAWYWRQVLSVLVMGVAQDLRIYKRRLPF